MTYNGPPYYPPEYDIDDEPEDLPAAHFSHIKGEPMNIKLCKTKSCQNLVTESEYYCGDCRLADFHNDADIEETDKKMWESLQRMGEADGNWRARRKK